MERDRLYEQYLEGFAAARLGYAEALPDFVEMGDSGGTAWLAAFALGTQHGKDGVRVDGVGAVEPRTVVVRSAPFVHQEVEKLLGMVASAKTAPPTVVNG